MTISWYTSILIHCLTGIMFSLASCLCSDHSAQFILSEILKLLSLSPPPPFHLAATECSCSLDSHLSKSWGTRWTAFRALIPLFCCYQGSSFRKCQICSSKINVQECDSTFDLKGFFFLLFSHCITFVFLWCIKELWKCSYRGWESRSLLTRLQVNVGI